MKVGVVGAGAIGGYLAVRIARAGHDVSIVARFIMWDSANSVGCVD